MRVFCEKTELFISDTLKEYLKNTLEIESRYILKKYFGYILTGISLSFKITYCSAGWQINHVPGCKVYHPPKTAGAVESGF